MGGGRSEIGFRNVHFGPLRVPAMNQRIHTLRRLIGCSSSGKKVEEKGVLRL